MRSLKFRVGTRKHKKQSSYNRKRNKKPIEKSNNLVEETIESSTIMCGED